MIQSTIGVKFQSNASAQRRLYDNVQSTQQSSPDREESVRALYRRITEGHRKERPLGKARSEVKLQAISPPEHFAIVEEGVYRSNFFHEDCYSFLRQLKLKTAVIMSPNAAPKGEKFCASTLLFDRLFAGVKQFLNDAQIKQVF